MMKVIFPSSRLYRASDRGASGYLGVGYGASWQSLSSRLALRRRRAAGARLLAVDAAAAAHAGAERRARPLGQPAIHALPHGPEVRRAWILPAERRGPGPACDRHPGEYLLGAGADGG